MKKIFYILIFLFAATSYVDGQTVGWTKVLDSLSIGRNPAYRYKFPATKSTDGKILKLKGGVLSWENDSISSIGGSGTVTSVGLSMPSIFSVSGSPITGSGILTANLNTAVVSTFLAGPVTGSPVTPTFRTINVLDLPNLSSYYIVFNKTLSTTAPLTGGGTLNTGLTIAMPAATTSASGYLTSTDWNTFNNKSNTSGTVTSASLTLPAEFSVTGSPVTTSGTLAGSWATQTTNKIFAAPNGSTGTPSFRSLVSADIPSLPYIGTSVGLSTTSPLTGGGTLNSGLTIAMPAATTSASGYLTSTDWNTFNNKTSNTGTVTSTGLTLPAEFSVTGSPVTTSGTLAGSWATQTTNKIFAAPNGSTGTPTFRALVAADIPALNYIQNQTAADQSAGFRINGNGIFNGGKIAVGGTSTGAMLQATATSTTQGINSSSANGYAGYFSASSGPGIYVQGEVGNAAEFVTTLGTYALYARSTSSSGGAAFISGNLRTAATFTTDGSSTTQSLPVVNIFRDISGGNTDSDILKINDLSTTSGTKAGNLIGAYNQNVSKFSVDITGKTTAAGKITAGASTTSAASFSAPHGTAPASPANGDIWTTSAGIYVQINGVTVGPLGSGGGGSATPTDIQVFTTTGANTWTKPTGAKLVKVILIGAGAGGGSGRKSTAGTSAAGGGGGAGGSYSEKDFIATSLSATETVIVGAGSAGGAAQTTNSTNGNPGSYSWDPTSFGSYLWASQGYPGGGGTTTAGLGGYNLGQYTIETGAAGANANISGSGAVGLNTRVAGASGGSGGTITAANAAAAGGSGGYGAVNMNNWTGGTAGAINTSGGNGSSHGTAASWYGGSGGGGGGSSVTGNGGNGGNGGTVGAGGGGGGAARDGVGNSGAGGAGANGLAVIITYF